MTTNSNDLRENIILTLNISSPPKSENVMEMRIGDETVFTHDGRTLFVDGKPFCGLDDDPKPLAISAEELVKGYKPVTPVYSVSEAEMRCSVPDCRIEPTQTALTDSRGMFKETDTPYGAEMLLTKNSKGVFSGPLYEEIKTQVVAELVAPIVSESFTETEIIAKFRHAVDQATILHSVGFDIDLQQAAEDCFELHKAIAAMQPCAVIGEDEALSIFDCAKSKWLLENQNMALGANYQAYGDLEGIRALLAAMKRDV